MRIDPGCAQPVAGGQPIEVASEAVEVGEVGSVTRQPTSAVVEGQQPAPARMVDAWLESGYVTGGQLRDFVTALAKDGVCGADVALVQDLPHVVRLNGDGWIDGPDVLAHALRAFADRVNGDALGKPHADTLIALGKVMVFDHEEIADGLEDARLGGQWEPEAAAALEQEATRRYRLNALETGAPPASGVALRVRVDGMLSDGRVSADEYRNLLAFVNGHELSDEAVGVLEEAAAADLEAMCPLPRVGAIQVAGTMMMRRAFGVALPRRDTFGAKDARVLVALGRFAGGADDGVVNAWKGAAEYGFFNAEGRAVLERAIADAAS